MASCEMCGATATTKAKIEGTTLVVCASCASFGIEIKERAPMPKVTLRTTRPEAVEKLLRTDFASRIRKARQKMDLDEKQAARLLNIKESTLLHYEAGKVIPDENNVKKLEKFYNLQLYENT